MKTVFQPTDRKKSRNYSPFHTPNTAEMPAKLHTYTTPVNSDIGRYFMYTSQAAQGQEIEGELCTLVWCMSELHPQLRLKFLCTCVYKCIVAGKPTGVSSC